MSLIERHARYTGSERAKTILANWAVWLPKFVKVMPTEYRRALKELAAKKSSLARQAAA
jgi:glutamate synthase domain-containing protein 3